MISHHAHGVLAALAEQIDAVMFFGPSFAGLLSLKRGSVEMQTARCTSGRSLEYAAGIDRLRFQRLGLLSRRAVAQRLVIF